MTRQILIHLHVEAPDSDTRDPNEIADAVGSALEFVQFEIVEPEDTANLTGLTFAVPLAEELEAR